MSNFQSAVLTLCDNLCSKNTSVIAVGKTADFNDNTFVYIFTTRFDLCRPSLHQKCQKQKQAVHKMPNYSHLVYGCFSVITSLEVMVCCGIRYVVYSYFSWPSTPCLRQQPHENIERSTRHLRHIKSVPTFPRQQQTTVQVCTSFIIL